METNLYELVVGGRKFRRMRGVALGVVECKSPVEGFEGLPREKKKFGGKILHAEEYFECKFRAMKRSKVKVVLIKHFTFEKRE